MFSTHGRCRALTDAQVREILEWQRNRKTLGQVARENGVSRGTVQGLIRAGGLYKRPPPILVREVAVGNRAVTPARSRGKS